MTEHKDAMTPGQVADMARWQKTMFDAGWVHLSNLLGYAKNAITDQAAELTALRAERDQWKNTAIAKIEMANSTAIDAVKAERDAALARMDAAFEAAGEVAAVFVHERLYKAKFPACSYHHADIKAAVKALTPADAQAALKTLIDAAVKEAWEKDAELLKEVLERLEYADQFIRHNRGGGGLRNPARTETIAKLRVKHGGAS